MMIQARRLGDVDYVAELGACSLFLTESSILIGKLLMVWKMVSREETREEKQ